MSNEPQILPGAEEITPSQPIEQPVIPVVEAPRAPVELRYEYQPTDEQGRPIGGRQVIKYSTPEELANKLAEQNTLLLRKLRTETRKNRLGITEPDAIEPDAPRFSETVSFKPRALTEEDKVRISRDLLDPERFDEASDELFTAKLGVSPTELTKTISELQADRITQRAIAEANAFAQATPDYLVCAENAEAITNWLLRYKLAPVRANFQRAYESLKSAGILIEKAPAVEPEPVPDPVTPVPDPAPAAVEPVVPVPAAEPVEEAPKPKPISRVPVALSRENTDDAGAPPANPGSDIVYEFVVNGTKRRLTGLAAVDAMPADEYRRRVMTDPNFSKKVEKLEQEKAARRKQR